MISRKSEKLSNAQRGYIALSEMKAMQLQHGLATKALRRTTKRLHAAQRALEMARGAQDRAYLSLAAAKTKMAKANIKPDQTSFKLDSQGRCLYPQP